MVEKKLELFTIICRNDYKLWRLQAKSVARFAQDDAVTAIHIVINETEDVGAMIDEFVRENLSAYGAWQAKTHFHSRHDFIDRPLTVAGWRTQQLIKLRAHRVMTGDRVVILDAKNHFIRPIQAADFFDEETGRPTVALITRSPQHSQYTWLVDSLAMVGVAAALADEPASQTTTPFPVTASHLRELEVLIAEKYGSLDNFFEEYTGRATEFLMMFAYAHKKYGTAEIYFKGDSDKSSTLFRRHPEDIKRIQAVIHAAHCARTPMFAVHAERIPHLGDEERNLIRDLWIKLGIADGKDCQDLLGANEQNSPKLMSA